MAEIIENPTLDVFERWGEAVKEIVGDDGYSYGVSSTIANDKEVYARILSTGSTSSQNDLCNDEISLTLYFQTEIYSTVDLNKAYEIDAVSHKAMTDMGFRRTFGAELINVPQNNVIRLVSRYTRVYTGYLLT